jgi:hypothetical protein
MEQRAGFCSVACQFRIESEPEGGRAQVQTATFLLGAEAVILYSFALGADESIGFTGECNCSKR